jgi:SET domain
LLIVAVMVPPSCHAEDYYHDHEEEVDDDEEEKVEYEEMTMDDIWHHFDCPRIFQQSRPVHSEQDWKDMQDIYQSIVGSSSTLDHRNGFSVPVQAKQAGREKGRGVFVTAPVTSGQLVWSTHKTARFARGQDYRTFLVRIRQDLACDVLQWAYVQALSDSVSQTDKAWISVDLDAGSFINSIGDEDDQDANLGCDEVAAKDHPGGCKHNYFALRDIQQGEELLLDYGDFAIRDGWQWFGL